MFHRCHHCRRQIRRHVATNLCAEYGHWRARHWISVLVDLAALQTEDYIVTETMIPVPFLRRFPTGNGDVQTILRPENIGLLAKRFLRAGGWYTVEILPTLRVRLAACDPGLGVLFGCDTDNGPPMMDAVDQLILDSQQFIQRPN